MSARSRSISIFHDMFFTDFFFHYFSLKLTTTGKIVRFIRLCLPPLKRIGIINSAFNFDALFGFCRLFPMFCSSFLPLMPLSETYSLSYAAAGCFMLIMGIFLFVSVCGGVGMFSARWKCCSWSWTSPAVSVLPPYTKSCPTHFSFCTAASKLYFTIDQLHNFNVWCRCSQKRPCPCVRCVSPAAVVPKALGLLKY